MCIQPAFEGAKFLAQSSNPLGVLNGGVDLEAVSNNARVSKQSGTVFLCEFGDLVYIKAAIGFAEVICFLQDGDPRKPRLIDLKDEALEEQVVILERKPILRIVVHPVESIFGVGVAVVAVGGHSDILLFSEAYQETSVGKYKFADVTHPEMISIESIVTLKITKA